MAAADHFDTVQKLYIAFYQRPADSGGLLYWSQRLDAADGSLEGIIDAFATSAETAALYGDINVDTIGDVIDAIYLALFNRAPDAEGKAFYVEGFAAGTFTAGSIALNVLNGAQNEDLVAIQNKVTVANLFTEAVDGRSMTDPFFGTGTEFAVTYAGEDDAVVARDWLAQVTDSPATIKTPAQVVADIQGAIANLGDPILAESQTFTLTASALQVNEGGVVLFTLQTTGVPAGTTYTYTISGNNVGQGDFANGQLTGVATIDSEGRAVFQVATRLDLVTEGIVPETVTVSIAGQTASFNIIDTSLTPPFELTTGVDTIEGNGLANVIAGNTDTYGSGDVIDGGAGDDLLALDLETRDAPYDVGNVENVEDLYVFTRESADGEDVTLLMSNYDDSLQTLNIVQSRADITVEDLQAGVDVVIDDMRGDVNIQFDQQNAPDEVNITIREFGQTATNAEDNSDLSDEADTDGAEFGEDNNDEANANKANDFGNYTADLTIDAGVATVNLTDAGTEGFENDLSIAGGFSTLNILGGQESDEADADNIELTIHDVNSTGLTVAVQAAGYLGDLAIDADGVDTLNSGVGDDVITTDVSYGGDINAGNGDNRVTIGSLLGEDSADDDLLAGGSITTGSGVDVVLVDDDSAGEISTGAGNDTVEIGADLGEGDTTGGDQTAGTVSTGAGLDIVRVFGDAGGTIDTGAAEDAVGDNDLVDITGNLAGSVTTGEGADGVFVGVNMSGDITTANGGDLVVVDGNVEGVNSDNRAVIDTGNDDDTVHLGASFDAVTGVVTFTGNGALLDNSEITTGAGNDDVLIGNGIQAAVNPFSPVFDVDAVVDLGAGNDELIVQGGVGGDILAGDDGDDLGIIDGSILATSQIDGGSDEAVDTLTLLDDSEDANDLAISGGADITGIEVLNLIDQVASGEDDFSVNLDAFDEALEIINISKDNEGGTEVNLFNVNGQQINISAEDNVAETDVTLNVTAAADVTSLAVSLESDINGGFNSDSVDMIQPEIAEGNTDFDVVINDDSEVAIADLTLTNNGSAIDSPEDNVKGRTVTLNGNDFEGTLTIDGNMAQLREGYAESDTRLRTQQDGNVLVVTGIAADTIVAGEYNGDLNLVLADDESHTITLGGGDDVVNLLGDTLDVNDNIDFGAGIDRLIVNEDTQTTGDDSDEVFGDLVSLEELELRGDGGEGVGSVLDVSLDDDAFRSDVARVIVAAADGLQGDAANVLLDIGADFYDDVADEGRDLRIDANSGRVLINNDSDNDLDIYTDTGTAGGLVDNGGRDILVDQNGSGTTTVTIGVDAGVDTVDIGAWTEGVEDAEYGAGWDDEIELDMLGGTLTSITLLDNHTGVENANVNLTVASNWAGEDDTLTIDASDITDDNVDSETGGVYVDGRLETDAVLHVTGSDNDDEIIGGQLGDTLIGGAGDDIIVGDEIAQDNFKVDTVTFGASYDAGDVVTVTIDGVDFDYTVLDVVDGGQTGAQVAAALALLINDPDTGSAVAGATALSNVLTLTGDLLGDDYVVATSVNNTVSNATAQVQWLANFDGAPDSGFTMTIIWNGSTYTYSGDGLVASAPALVTAVAALGGTVEIDPDNFDLFIYGLDDGSAFPLITQVTSTDLYSLQLTAGSANTNTDEAAPVVANVTPAVTELGGDDTINGGEGNNELYGSVGNDTITAGSGNNYVEGGVGNDEITLGNGANEVYGDDGDDTIEAGLEGTNLVDGNNYVDGGAGNDTITLGDGNDTVLGGAGNDTINAGAGNDTITGGLGADNLTGGSGSDTFVYDSQAESTGVNLGFDTISGFTAGAGGDVFDLTGIALSDLFNGEVVFLGNFENENIANTAIASNMTDALEVVFVSYGVAGEGWIYADSNQSGSIDTTDLAIKVVGIEGVFADVNFATPI